MKLCEIVAEYAADGMTPREIADVTGSSYDTVYTAIKRSGIKVTRERDLNYRDKAESMRPRKAIEYLCKIIDRLTGEYREASSKLHKEYGVRLTPNEARLFAVLSRSIDNLVMYDEITVTIGAEKGKPLTTDALYAHLKHLRRKLIDTPYHVETVKHSGLRLVKINEED